jgi:hypothetical protein
METTATDLAYRRDGGIEVVLFWDKPTGNLTVSVADLASGDAFELPVAADCALDGFHHPYAYAASMGIGFQTAAVSRDWWDDDREVAWSGVPGDARD